MKSALPTKKKVSPIRKRVLLVDDHLFLRMGLAEAIGSEPGLAVCGVVGSAEEALAAVEQLSPQIVVTDLNLPDKHGLELIKDLAILRPGLPVVVLSMHDEEVYAERCLRAGARGYVTKTDGPETLVAAIRHVLAGEIHVSAKTTSHILKIYSDGRQWGNDTALGQLTDREFEVFQWLGRGFSTQAIADRLHVSPKTVGTHRVNIKAKLGLHNTAELIAYAARWIEDTH